MSILRIARPRDYAHQLHWMLGEFENIQAHAATNEFPSHLELVAARQELFAMRDDIAEATGILVELAPRLSLASPSGPASGPFSIAA